MQADTHEEALQPAKATMKAEFAFLTELMRLKAVPRMGWLLRGIRDVESVADHSFGVAVLAMLLADRARQCGLEIDTERVLRMSLLHDLTEARTGDLPNTIKRYFDREALHAADGMAANEMLADLDEGERYLELWREYEERSTIESRIVKIADKLDLLFQAREYEKGGARNTDEFWLNSDLDLNVPQLPAFKLLVEDLFNRLSQDRGVNG
jgi:putative hydrolases of HD superfamily